jgi:23S rRNA pseudouridine2605 synthase
MVDHPDDVEPDEPPGQAGDGERVAKALARAGVASRRDVERLIADRRVRLNGQVLDTPAVRVAPGDILMVDGKVVDEPEPTRLWRYHKPVGLVTTHKDPGGRPTVFERLPEGLPRVISVGRLDLNSEGLLLLTNDGALARALELPATGWVRTYRARAHGRTDQARLDTLKDGITVEGVRYGPIQARLDKAKEGATASNLWITVSLTEGKNREVRRVLEALGLKVNRLIRLAYGPFQLGTLGVGEAEEVGPRVIREQLSELMPGMRVAAGPVREIGAPPKLPRAKSDGGPGSTKGGRAAAPIAQPPAKTVYKPGWAKPKKRPGPPRPRPAKPRPERAEGAGARSGPASPAPGRSRPGPKSRPASAAPRRTSPARPPGPPRGGGPKRRG